MTETSEEYGQYLSGESYKRYYERYFENIRECDKVLLTYIASICEKRNQRTLNVVEFGCSTGVLLYHMKRTFPELNLLGTDLYPDVVHQCQQNPDLAGIEFQVADILSGIENMQFDIAIVNAVFALLDENQFQQSLSSIFKNLHPGGVLVAFDWLHPFDQHLTIEEISETHPNGLVFRFRNFRRVEQMAQKVGFHKNEFLPFHIPIDLKPTHESFSRTIPTSSGDRMIFRGCLMTPWCHWLAERA